MTSIAAVVPPDLSSGGAGGALFGEPDQASARAAARVDRLIAAIDTVLTRQLNAIFAAPSFRALEARWRALSRLAQQAGSDGQVIVRVLDASWPEVVRDLDRAVEFDQSHLHKLVYDGEFGMPGGLPFGLIVGDYAVSSTTDRARGDQVDALSQLSAVGAAAFCPIILGGAPDLLGVDDFARIAPHTDLSERRDGRAEQYLTTRWQSLRKRDDARFLGVVAPDVVIRAPRKRLDASRADGFTFDEDPSVPLTVSGAYAFAATVIAAFKASGWFAAIRGAVEDDIAGGTVPGWPGLDLGTDNHGLSTQPPVSLRLTAAQENALVARGIVPLSALPLTDMAVFNANPSLHRPAQYDSVVATENARISAMLQYVLCTSRFAHYLKVMMREQVGSVTPAEMIERQLSDWLLSYCLGNDDADRDLKAQYPLRTASVSVASLPGRPGAYSAMIRLQPHFQLDDISTSFHLVSEAPAGLERAFA
ncbi:type VI secretion system contractile sheath large subunit [Tateyamaria omphalii]|uniref:type VI secretion system contractile sheath large subunit n=1 Tax=Tateyamaria omphalii TaxID=299262 RepID=UPI001C99DF69|nr:type VI secretion system contractile sheath large subunit [Tateyamaria omphalii]MBY5931945.1 type VI secretion system contractile sheath large subunit [Tateyamaria omphalii]